MCWTHQSRRCYVTGVQDNIIEDVNLLKASAGHSTRGKQTHISLFMGYWGSFQRGTPNLSTEQFFFIRIFSQKVGTTFPSEPTRQFFFVRNFSWKVGSPENNSVLIWKLPIFEVIMFINLFNTSYKKQKNLMEDSIMHSQEVNPKHI